MINRIDGPRPLSPTTPVRKTAKTSRTNSSAFSEHLHESDEVSGAAGTGAIGSITGVLDIQEVDDALDRAAKGKLRAEDLLNKLDDLRLDLLTGQISKEKLQNLAQTINNKRSEIDDLRLRQILDEIDLRAQVELAKFTRA